MVLPNLLIVGAAKSGTTSLSHYLRQHPDVFIAREKESHHFAADEIACRLEGPGDREGLGRLLISDRPQYEACFARGGGASIRGESSVYYSAYPEALRRALDEVPDMQFIYMMRHPVHRAISGFSHMKRDGREPLDLAEALDAEDQRESDGWSQGFMYRRMSDYPEQIREMQAAVGAERIHIVVMEELLSKESSGIDLLMAALGLPARDIDTSLALNQSGAPRSRLVNDLLVSDNALKRGLKRVVPYSLGTSMAERIRSRNLTPLEYPFPSSMREEFRGYASGTEEILGREIPVWRTVDDSLER